MRFSFLLLVVFCSVLAFPALALSPASFKGMGHGCAGDFTITETMVNWQAAHVECPNLSYRVLKEDRKSGRTVLQVNKSGDCPYGILVLSHDGPDPDHDWSVTGYHSEKDYAAGDRSEAQSCFLTRSAE